MVIHKKPEPMKVRNNNVLFVDDDNLIFELIKRKLDLSQFNMFWAIDGDQALDVLEENEIAVVVSDLRMPKISGISLLEIVHKKYPDVVRIAMSSAKDINTLLAVIERGQIYRYIRKPLLYDAELIPAICAGLNRYDITKAEQEEKIKIVQLNEELEEKNIQILEMEQKERRKNEIVLNLLRRFTKEVDVYSSQMIELLNYIDPNIIQKEKYITDSNKIKEFAESIIKHIREL